MWQIWLYLKENWSSLVSLNISIPPLSPAVFHQVQHDLVQHLLNECGVDPHVSDGLRREVWGLGHLTGALAV